MLPWSKEKEQNKILNNPRGYLVSSNLIQSGEGIDQIVIKKSIKKKEKKTY